MNKLNSVEGQTENDEIDLGVVVLRLAGLVKKNKWWWLMFAFLGLALGVLSFIFGQPKYKSDMILTTKLIGEDKVARSINLLDQLLKEEDYGQLSSMLGLSLLEAETLEEIEAAPLKEDSEGSNDNSNFVSISLISTDTAMFDKFEARLVGYLNGLEYIKRRREDNRGNIDKRIAYLDAEIKGIEKLKDKIESGEFHNNNQDRDLIMYDPSKVYQQSIAMNNTKLQLHSELKFIDDIEVLQPFLVHKKPIGYGLILHMLIYLFISMFFALMITLSIEVRHYLKKLNLEQK